MRAYTLADWQRELREMSKREQQAIRKGDHELAGFYASEIDRLLDIRKDLDR